jgi:hypothetical protein
MPRIIFAFAGPAYALRTLLQAALELPPPLSHAEAAARAVARLALLAEQSATWRVHGREVAIGRLMRAVAEEVEP